MNKQMNGGNVINLLGRSHQRGFTLIEMMIVVTIVGILASIAVPALSDYLAKSRRTDARSMLIQIQGKQEQFFLNNRSYTDNFTQLGTLSTDNVTADVVTTENGYYTIAMSVDREVAGRIYEYTLTATAIGRQVADVCDTLTIDEGGTKGFTPPTATGCW